jgi:hypothetical protein
MNAICERLAGTLRCEVVDRTLILAEAHLRAVLTEYQTLSNMTRPHGFIDRLARRGHMCLTCGFLAGTGLRDRSCPSYVRTPGGAGR